MIKFGHWQYVFKPWMSCFWHNDCVHCFNFCQMWSVRKCFSFISLIFERQAFQPSIINLIIWCKLKFIEELKLEINIHSHLHHHLHPSQGFKKIVQQKIYECMYICHMEKYFSLTKKFQWCGKKYFCNILFTW